MHTVPSTSQLGQGESSVHVIGQQLAVCAAESGAHLGEMGHVKRRFMVSADLTFQAAY
jgi:hypothetical protein